MSSGTPSLDWLEQFSFGEGLSSSARETIRNAVASVSAPEGALILNEGAACDPVAFLTRGTIRVFKRAGEGREITLYRVRPGEVCVVAVTSALADTPYPATAVVTEPIEGFTIPVEVFRQVFTNEPPLQSFVMRLVADRLAMVMRAVVEVGFQSLDRRVARFLLDASAQAEVPGTLALTHEEIAGELGTAREVVTRVLDSFAAQGLVSLGRRHIDLSEESGLRELAGHAG